MKRILLCCSIIFSMALSGCGKQLGEKDILLVADGNLFLEKSGEKYEFSHAKIIILHEKDVEKGMKKIIEHREISLQAKVAFCGENITEKVSKDKKEITKQLKDLDTGKSISILEFLNKSCEGREKIEIPEIEVKDEKMKIIGYRVYDTGNKW